MAQTWYIDGDNGVDANGGHDPALPRQHIPPFGIVTDGDTFYLAGVVRNRSGGGVNMFTGFTGLSFRQWPGQRQGYVWGGTRVDAADWTSDSATTWKTTMTPVNGIASVFVYDSVPIAPIPGVAPATFPHQPAGGILVHASSLANCRATDNSWWYASNTLTVNLKGDDPSGITNIRVEYCDTDGTNLLQFDTCTGCSVDGLIFALNPHNTGGQGYGIYMTDCTGGTVSNCSGFDLGPHHFGILSSTGAQVLVNLYGEGGTEDCAYYVFYTNTGADLAGASGTSCNCTFRRWLLRDGTEFAVVTSASQSLTTAHVDAGGTIADLLWVNCTGTYNASYHSGGFPSWHTLANVATVTAGNRKVWSSYPVRADGGGMVGPVQYLPYTAPIAVRRARFSTTGAWTSDQGYGRGDFYLSGNYGAYRSILFEACEFIGNTDSSSAGHETALFQVTNENAANHDQVVLINCSVYDSGVQDASNIRAFFEYFDMNLPVYECYGCVFERKTPGTHACSTLCWADSSVPTSAANHVFDDCVYKNIDDGTGRWSKNSAINAASEWLASVDTHQVIKTGTLFPNAPTNLLIDSTSQLWPIRRATSTVVPSGGIRTSTYLGFFGADQPNTLTPGRTKRGGDVPRVARVQRI